MLNEIKHDWNYVKDREIHGERNMRSIAHR